MHAYWPQLELVLQTDIAANTMSGFQALHAGSSAFQKPFTAHNWARDSYSARLRTVHCLKPRCPAQQTSGLGCGLSARTNLSHGRQQHTLQAGEVLYELADIDAKTAATIASLLGPALNIGQLLMIIRIVLSWYPNINYGKLPWVLAVRPTEPILAPTRKVIPIVGGLDVTPIVWVALLSFINEILLGPQGILNLLQRKADL